MKNHLYSTFYIVHILILLNLSRNNSKNSGRECLLPYYKKNKIKNEFTIKLKSGLEHRTELKNISEENKVSPYWDFYVYYRYVCIDMYVCRYIYVYICIVYVWMYIYISIHTYTHIYVFFFFSKNAMCIFLLTFNYVKYK